MKSPTTKRAAARRQANRQTRRRKLRSRTLAARRRHARQRRGVLLLVVLSMLVLFMMIGTAFMVTSSQYRTAAKNFSKFNRVGNFPTELLDRALMQVLRDTNNPFSVVRYHSLLRDMYGTDGFEAVVQAATYSRSINAPVNSVALGPTQGQLIDLYIVPDQLNGTALPQSRHVLQLERDASGQRRVKDLPLTTGYYNGALLTITSGPARGQSARVVEYAHESSVPREDFSILSFTQPNQGIWRFRVMAFARADGSSFSVDNSSTPPSITDLQQATFVVNGQPYNGTGVGYNAMSQPSQPRLSASELVLLAAPNPLYAPVALLPNSTQVVTNNLWSTVAGLPAVPLNNYGIYSGPGGCDESYDAPDFQNMFLAHETVKPHSRGRIVIGGGSDVPDALGAGNRDYSAVERFDLADLPIPSFHRPALANYWFHRLVLLAAGNDLMQMDSDPSYSVTAPTDEHVVAVLQPYGPDNLRDDDPNDSGDNPSVDIKIRDQIVAIKRRISMRPLREDHPDFDGSNRLSRGRDWENDSNLTRNINGTPNIVAPYWEAMGPWDVDNDNDGVPDSNWIDLGDPVQQAEDGTLYKALYAFKIVDMDSRLNVNAHGTAEHVNPPQFDPNRNVLAGDENTPPSNDKMPHGMGWGTADISLRPLFPVPLRDDVDNFDRNITVADGIPDYLGNRTETLFGNVRNPNQEIDSYATLLSGRATASGRAIVGRYGFDSNFSNDRVPLGAQDSLNNAGSSDAAPGITSIDPAGNAGAWNSPDARSQFDFHNSPLFWNDPSSSFAKHPDLSGRYAQGVDHSGQPVHEGSVEPNPAVLHSLLADTPYELDLSTESRRGVRTDRQLVAQDATVPETYYFDTRGNQVGPAVPGLMNDNDDGTFATAEMERMLRAHDADAGAVPSRLWDLVDAFDPEKLIYGSNPDTGQAFATINTAGPNDPTSSEMNAAQQQAAINRRLVTTDSYDLPVPGASFGPRLLLGADGGPGVVGFDDDNQNGIDDVGEIGFAGTDDYRALMGSQPPAGAKLVDLLQYRIQYEKWKREGASFARFNAAELNILVSGLLAPELLAGRRLDINRPFGDGKDNGDGIDEALDNNGNVVSNGIIDDPTELGHDLVLNGVVDEPGEQVRHVNGFDDNNLDGVDEPNEANLNDRIWNPSIWDSNARAWVRDSKELPFPGMPAGGVTMDNTNGTDVNGNGLLPEQEDQVVAGDEDSFVSADGLVPDNYNGNAPLTTDVAPVRDRLLARQLYARHLYVLMMMLVDEEYSATLDPSNPNDTFLLQTLQNDLLTLRNIARTASGNLAEEEEYEIVEELAKHALRKKLTARRIAQWAINCVDFRDSDSIMTPFEYDENPFDGWGVTKTDGSGDFLWFSPLDGNPHTNENWGNPELQYPQTQDADLTVGDDASLINIHLSVALPDSINDPVALSKIRDEATRGIVWGIERPELLITETMAFHDRRATDEEHVASVDDGGHKQIGLAPVDPTDPNQLADDDDLDQKLVPRGSLFVELYNPWSLDGPKAAELYGANAVRPNDSGVLLNRLSNTPFGSGKFSPVWRMIVVQDPAAGRLTNQVAEGLTEIGELANLKLRSIDTNGYGFDSDKHAERYIYFTTGAPQTQRNDDNDLGQEYLNNFPRMINLDVHVPPLPFRNVTIKGGTTKVRTARRYFIGRKRRFTASSVPGIDVVISPILPGHYAVVGSSGLPLNVDGQVTVGFVGAIPDDELRYVTTLGRHYVAGGFLTSSVHAGPAKLTRTRRIEMWPSPDPLLHQMLVDDNGGPEFLRDPDSADGWVNCHDPDLNGVPGWQPGGSKVRLANGGLDFPMRPCVAIPVEDLSISEPVEGYPSVLYRQLHIANTTSASDVTDKPSLNSDGDFEFPRAYDTPMDMEFELVRNGTTHNYRSLHLQRLANPLLPWNPLLSEARDSSGAVILPHDPARPVNPYLTIDSMSVDLTAFNGLSNREQDLPMDPEAIGYPTGVMLQGEYFAPLTPEEVLAAPPHVVRELLNIFVSEGVISRNARPTIDTYLKRQRSSIANDLDSLETAKRNKLSGLPTGILGDRGDLLDASLVGTGPSPQWGWHKLRRVLPDTYQYSGPSDASRQVPFQSLSNTSPADFKQTIALKSLERGGHHRMPHPIDLDGWIYDPNWEPRLLWKHERPNGTFFVKAGPGSSFNLFSDLVSSKSLRLLGEMGYAGGTGPISTDDALFHSFLDGLDNRLSKRGKSSSFNHHVFPYVMRSTLGFANEAFVPEIDFGNAEDATAPGVSDDKTAMIVDLTNGLGAPEVDTSTNLEGLEPQEMNLAPFDPRERLSAAGNEFRITSQNENKRRRKIMASTYPWFPWNDRPYISGTEIMQVPSSSAARLFSEYSVINSKPVFDNDPKTVLNPYNGDRLVNQFVQNAPPIRLETRGEQLDHSAGHFGHLMNFLASSPFPATLLEEQDGTDYEETDGDDEDSPDPKIDEPNEDIDLDDQDPADQDDAIVDRHPVGAPNYYRFLEFVHVPSRFVNTDTLLNPVTFADIDYTNPDPTDPRWSLRPPYNRVPKYREPGRVNLNTVSGRRVAGASRQPAQIWSEVYDGVMHRLRDGERYNSFGETAEAAHFGPAWKDVVLSRRGYAHFAVTGASFTSMDKRPGAAFPDMYAFGLNRNFPTLFANPFRAPDAGDLVPLDNMVQSGVNASMLRAHPFNKGTDTAWGEVTADDGLEDAGIASASQRLDDTREAGFENDILAININADNVTSTDDNFSIPNVFLEPDFPAPGATQTPSTQSNLPLFSESLPAAHVDAERNPYNFYQPLTRLGNLATTRSGVFAIWITVGYFEVESAPAWTDPDGDPNDTVQERFASNRNLYDRVYPDGYQLGREVGIDTGDSRRHRGFYIVDRTLPVAFKPGEDLNVENMIRLRRRIE